MEHYPKGHEFQPEWDEAKPSKYYTRGWLWPKTAKDKYVILDDPELIQKKNTMRQALKDEYYRKVMNPYRHAAGVGGTVFDPQMQRLWSTHRMAVEFLRPNSRVSFAGLMLLLVPGSVIAYGLWFENADYYERIRNGEIAYADREGRHVT